MKCVKSIKKSITNRQGQRQYTEKKMQILFYFLKIFIYLFLKSGEGKEKGREISMCGCLSCAPHWGPSPQPRHVPWIGSKPATLSFTGRHSIHWATPSRAENTNFKCDKLFNHPYSQRFENGNNNKVQFKSINLEHFFWKHKIQYKWHSAEILLLAL